MERIIVNRPGAFSVQAAADSRRCEFDIKNEAIMTKKLPVSVVFIGDSITHFWELDAFFVKDKGLLVNRGIAGDNTEFVMKRFEADVLQLRPETVVLKIGVNDIWVLEDYPWVIGPRKHSSEEIINPIISRISKMIDLAIEQNINIAVCSILPSNMTWTAHNGERNVIIAEINQRLKQISNEKKAIYVDFHSHFADPDGLTLRNGLTDDGLHPHVVGYEIMAQVLSNTLMEHGIKLQTI